jgi:2-dehydro-3-deoxygalactonokinase
MPAASPQFAAVDWGTSNMRVWMMAEDGAVLGETRGEEGLTRVQDRNFEGVLEAKLAALGAPQALPVIICGMAGSKQGWLEAKYVETPANLSDVTRHAVKVPHASRDIRILPGISHNDSDAPSVMRGEETQLLGLPSHTGNQTVCMPGTHCKWVRLEGSTVVSFATYLTGELFNLFSTVSLLKYSVDPAAKTGPDHPDFLADCTRMLADPGDLTANLFAIRAAGLLQGLAPDRASATLSGLLIGSEIGSARKRFDNKRVTLVRSGRLGRLYEAALGLAGYPVDPVDAEDTVKTGLAAAAKAIWPQGELR